LVSRVASAGQVVVEAGQHVQLGQGLLADVDPAQGVRHHPGGVSDDVGVAGVGLRRPRVQVSDPPHRQAGQVGHAEPHRPGDGDRQRTDRVGLVDHDQHRSVLAQPGEQVS
jgi:hypothetical protein